MQIFQFIKKVQTHNIRMVNVQENLFFRMQMHQLILLYDLSFTHNLQSVHLFFTLKSDQFNPTKRSITKCAQNLQIVFLKLLQNLLVFFIKLLHFQQFAIQICYIQYLNILQLLMSQQPTNPFQQSYTQEQSTFPHFSSMPVTLDQIQNTPMSRYIQQSDSPIVKINLNSQQTTNRNQTIHEEEIIKKDYQNDDIDDLKLYVDVLEKRNAEMAICLERQKIKNQHFEQAFNLIKRQDKNVGNKVHEQGVRLSILETQLEKQKLQNENLLTKLETSKAQNNYLKELILLANNNYENVYKKYEELLVKNQETQSEKALNEKNSSTQMQEIKNILASLMKTNQPETQCGKKENLKHNYSSNKSQKQEMEDVYRKMFIKTLKTKK